MEITKNSLLFIFIIIGNLISGFAHGQNKWKEQNIPLANRYDDVFFLDENVGFTINSEGGFYKTTNGGTDWLNTFTFKEYLRCVEFIDPQIGFCGSLDSAFYKTNDGGNTWQNISTSLNTPFSIPGICAISISENTIYAGGKWSGPGFVVKSTDDGNSWQYIGLDSLTNGIVELDFINANVGFAAGKSNISSEGGVILKTIDGGITWRKVATTELPSEYVWKLHQINATRWVGSIQGNPASKALRYLQSEDSGETWSTKQVIDTFYQSQTIGFLNENYGVTGGVNQLFETFDGGDSWSKIKLGASHNRFYKVNDSTAFLSGDKIYKTQKLNIGGNTTHKPFSHNLKVLPFKEHWLVSFNIPKPSFIIIKVLDLKGKQISIVENNFITAKNYSKTIETSNFSNGFYFLVLSTNYGQEIIKVYR